MSAPPQRAEAGYTLTEVLVAVTILTVAIVVILGAMSDGILASRVHRDIVTSDAVARSYAEQVVNEQVTPYVPCAKATNYPFTAPAGFTATITSIQYWNGTTPATFGPGCPTTDLGVQQITIEAHNTSSGGSQTLQILKRQS